MKNIDFKRIALKTLKFVIIFVITDFLFGTLASKLFFNQETGKYARSTYVIKKAKEDIIVFGSSHAHRHYVPEVISKKLSKTCYNAGADGQQLVYHNVLQKMILNRYHPEIIILNIDEEFLFKSNKSIDRLGDLHPYYFDFKDEVYIIKLLSINLIFSNFEYLMLISIWSLFSISILAIGIPYWITS